jgi:NADH dehydrogenase I D subunit
MSEKDQIAVQKGHEDDSDLIPINIGPSHPAVHGTLPIFAKLDGEVIAEADVEIGYLHRGFEKLAEGLTYHQFIPFTDRLNYVSTFINNQGYCEAVEKLLGIEVPERAQYIRVMLSEMSRIMDHITCLGPNMVDMGALTVFWYLFRERENLYKLAEMSSGGRMTTSHSRIGGLVRDLPEGFEAEARKILEGLPNAISDTEKLLKRNRIFLDRSIGVGAISAEDAVDWGFSGPNLRAAGVARDIRKDEPYAIYDKLEFDIPVGKRGDAYDRFFVRVEEMRQSRKMILQILDELPDGPVNVDDPRVILPAKEEVYNTMEGLIHHFMLIIDGISDIPKGEIYHAVEGANGELGFYIISNGGNKPYRLHFRSPCFAYYQAFPWLIKGSLIADTVINLGSLNVVAGELDR